MIRGVALAYHRLPLELIERHGLDARVHERGGEKEIRFLWGDPERLLPVWHGDQLRLVTWGGKRGESREFPCSGWTWLDTVVKGGWAKWGPSPVDIPATVLCHGKVWYGVTQGVRGLLVRDEEGKERVVGI